MDFEKVKSELSILQEQIENNKIDTEFERNMLYEYIEKIDRYGFRDEKGFWYLNFHPSTDLLDAWKVVEKLKITVIPQADGAPKFMRYLAEIDNRPFDKHYTAFAETAPLAICLTALKSVGVEVKENE